LKLLLDTHTWVWAAENQVKLGVKCRKILADSSNELFISPISTLELAQLISKKRLRLSLHLDKWIEVSVSTLILLTAEFDHKVAQDAYSFQEPFHNDPSDRILVATAMQLGALLVTADKNILRHKWIPTLAADR